RTFILYRQSMRAHLELKPLGESGQAVVATAAQHAAYTMSDPADLINLAIEYLVQQRFELPAFSTLDRLVMHIRHGVHQDLYTRITASFGPAERDRLDGLLQLRDGRTDFTR